jgi:outer membrane protein OmpA-like peptidoglycan-associated protein
MGVKQRGFALFAAALMVSTSAIAQVTEREGVIVSRSQSNLNVRTREGNITVVVTPSTRIRENRSGALAGSRDSNTGALIPGLIIKAEGDQQGSTLTAEQIEFRERDWRAAIAATGGTQQQFQQAATERAALRQAIIDGNEYEIRQEVTVYFPTGSAAVGAQYQEQLRALARAAPGFGNYRISIIGFADSRGDPAANERLSLRRAIAVSNFVRQTGAIQPGRVLSPSAMGETAAAPGMEAPTSNDQARRVVVRVVTPKGQLTQ